MPLQGVFSSSLITQGVALGYAHIALTGRSRMNFAIHKSLPSALRKINGYPRALIEGFVDDSPTKDCRHVFVVLESMLRYFAIYPKILCHLS